MYSILKQGSFLEKDEDKVDDYKYQEKVNWEEVRGQDIIPCLIY